MTTLGIIITGIFVLIGIVLVFFNLPGLWLVWLSITISSAIEGFNQFPLWLIVIFFFVVLFLQIFDAFFATAGSKKFGASKSGMIGSFVGGLLGFIILNLPGLLIGPFVGAVVFEYLFAKKDINDSIKAGIGTFFGIALGVALKVGSAIVLSGLWLWLVLR
jgi:uncharacterized protein YqgC (DUF456 family)